MVQQISIFISYRMEDKKFVEPFIEYLQKEDYKLLLSVTEPGKDWADELIRMQREATGTIIFWTRSGISSTRMMNELKMALDLKNNGTNKFLIVLTQGEDNPAIIPENIPVFNTDKSPQEDIISRIHQIINQPATSKTEIKTKDIIFGYNILVKNGDRITSIKGENVPELRLGMKVRLSGDSRGYVPGGFTPGAEVTITGFTEPFTKGESDHIIRVSDNDRSGWVKPSNIQKPGAGSASSSSATNAPASSSKSMAAAPVPEIQLANKYSSDINSFFEKQNDWWRVAQEWNKGEYGKKIRESLNAAKLVFETSGPTIEKPVFKTRIRRFLAALKDVVSVTQQQDKNNRSLALYASSSDNNNEIRSIAQSTIDGFANSNLTDVESCWILKLNDNNWEIENLKAGDEIYFHSHTFDQQKRAGYEAFQEIKKGDIVFGYAYGNRNAIACRFEITEALHQNPSLGEIISLRITELINPVIPSSSFIEKVNFANDLGPTSPKKLFPLPFVVYEDIINLPGQQIPPVTASNFLPFLETEGNHATTIDQLDFENDIESLASVIAMKEVKPPLAIGLFGKWGSGKSFFMKQLKKKIIELKNYDKETYVQHVVHVEFNSWHYSDTNLWASMVTKIFDALDQYSKGIQEDDDPLERIKRSTEKIKVLNGQKATIETEKQKLEKEIQEKEERQKKQREELADLTGFKILKLVLSDKRVREDYSELKNSDIENIVNDRKKINQYAEELEKSKNEVLAIFKIIGSFRGKKWLFAILTVGAIFLIKLLAETVFKDQYNNITKFLSVQSASLLAIAANLLKYIADARKSITRAHDKMVSLQQTFDSRSIADDKVNELKEKKNQIENELKNIEVELTKTKKDIEDVESGRMLLDFVEQRSKDSNYASQLGLISWIRKDFENLTRLLSGQDAALKAARTKQPGEKEPEVVLKVDRIILYIDDLDRCNEDLVVKVLEAIHLILAFELFVVIVGVDPRWLNNALNEKYRMLFGTPQANGQLHSPGSEIKKEKSSNGKTNEKTETKVGKAADIKIRESILDAATSYDYLEKIFQIPFCLKPINKTGREKLIGYLLDRGSKPEERVDSDLSSKVEPDTPAPATLPVAVPVDPLETKLQVDQVSTQPEPVVPEQGIQIAATENTIAKAGDKSSPEKKFAPPIRVNFTENEKSFMKKMSVLFGQSPRSINRFVNIYRIIKAHKGFYNSGEYSFEKFAPTLLLLGVVVGHSVHASDFIDAVTDEKDETKFRTFIKKSTLNKELVKEIQKCSDDKLWDMEMIHYKRDLNLISRFSFRTLIDE